MPLKCDTWVLVNRDMDMHHCGTFKDCKVFKEYYPYSEDYWMVLTIQEYGDFCYNEGKENAFDV